MEEFLLVQHLLKMQSEMVYREIRSVMFGAAVRADILPKCKYFSGNQFLHCAVNPGSGCRGCQDFEE